MHSQLGFCWYTRASATHVNYRTRLLTHMLHQYIYQPKAMCVVYTRWCLYSWKMHSPILISCGSAPSFITAGPCKWGYDYIYDAHMRRRSRGENRRPLFGSFVSSPAYADVPLCCSAMARERWDAVNQTAAQGFLIPVNFLLSAGKPFIFCIHAHHKKTRYRFVKHCASLHHHMDWCFHHTSRESRREEENY